MYPGTKGNNLQPQESESKEQKTKEFSGLVARSVAILALSPPLVAAIVFNTGSAVILTLAGIIAALAGVDVTKWLKK